MTLDEWKEVPGNIDWYNKVFKTERMNLLLEAIERELGFETRPPEMISGQLALTLHGRNTGAKRYGEALRNVNSTKSKVEDAIATYSVNQKLMDMGYSEAEAKALTAQYFETEGVE